MNNYCIISHEYQFIYIPIAKVACTSLLNRVLEVIYSSKNGISLKSHRDVHSRRKALFNTKFSEIHPNTFDAIKKYPNYYTFAFTRNPFERVHSCYVDKLSTQSYGFDQNLIKKYSELRRGIGFKDFLNISKKIPVHEMDEHFRPQYTFFPMDNINFVGRLDSVEEDWEVIENELNIANKPLSVFNKTEEVDYYDEEAENIVREIYQKDFQFFKYDTKRIPKEIPAKELPLEISAACDKLYPFKDVLIKKREKDIEIKTTSKDSILLIPFFNIRKGKGLNIDVDLISSFHTNLIFFYTTKDAIVSPQSRKITKKIVPGKNKVRVTIYGADTAGRLRLNPSTKPATLWINSIRIREHTLHWSADKEDLTSINKKIFSLPDYTQNHKNLFSMVNYASLFEPILNSFQPKFVCEIGCDDGDNTKFLFRYCKKNNAQLILVDPVKPNIDFIQSETVKYFQMKSVDFLQTADINSINVFFIDGDHNYQTVLKELNLIKKLKDAIESPCCVLLHDISWPWAYRNLYYDPEAFNLKESQFVRDTKVSLYSGTSADEGLPSISYAIDRNEGGPKNGVKKAVEDFLMQNSKEWDFVSIPSLYGLGIMWTPHRLNQEQERAINETVNNFNYFSEFLSILEWNRVVLYSHITTQTELLKKQKEDLDKVERIFTRRLGVRIRNFLNRIMNLRNK